MRNTRTGADTTSALGTVERRRWRASDATEQPSEEALRGMVPEPADAAWDDLADKDSTLLRAARGKGRRFQRSMPEPSDALDTPPSKERP